MNRCKTSYQLELAATKGRKLAAAIRSRDLERAYDRVKRNDLWRTLSMHGVSSGLIQKQHSLRGFKTCVRINGEYTDWFDIRRGLRQGCVASPGCLTYS
ncbi:hypothetical protein EVAR_99470_1 [Eumeta japonica]|uniref:Uncharacterized protein n=1 Tax=Eumeta variegata TaxID=151549 RepID=A0A4C1SKF4_EUMVA|nr:hypothetical protein EVAR_99470_1 [Eumeta japonica]